MDGASEETYDNNSPPDVTLVKIPSLDLNNVQAENIVPIDQPDKDPKMALADLGLLLGAQEGISISITSTFVAMGMGFQVNNPGDYVVLPVTADGRALTPIKVSRYEVRICSSILSLNIWRVKL